MSANTKLVLKSDATKDNLLGNLQYTSGMPSFLPVKNVEKGIITLHQNFQRFADCREILVGETRAILADKKDQEGKNFTGFSRLRYLAGFCVRDQEAVERCHTIGMRIVRTFDRVLKCRPTHIYSVSEVHTAGGRRDLKSAIIFLLEADKPWSKSPAMVSLHSLLFRLGANKIFNPIRDIPYANIPEKMISLAEKCKEPTDDLARVVLYTKAWVKFLKSYNKDLAKKKFTTTFLLDRDDADSGTVYDDGIDVVTEEMTGESIEDYIDKKEYQDEEYY